MRIRRVDINNFRGIKSASWRLAKGQTFVALIGPGDSTTLTVDLEPGQYVFYCSVGNHRGMGMEVTVTVT